MAPKARNVLNKLKSKKDEILRLHGPRSPMDAKISSLIDEYAVLDRDDESVFLQSRFDLCDLYLAKGDVLPALTELVTASEFRVERATKKAAEIVSRIHTKKYTRTIKTYNASDIKSKVSTILNNSEDGFFKNRLQIFFSIYKKDLVKALALTGENISLDPRAGVSDFIFVVRRLSQRQTHADFLPLIGKIINDKFKEIIDHGGRTLIQELEEKYRSDEAAIQALALKPENRTSFQEFVHDSTFNELLAFINNSDVFLFADALAEAEKDILIDEFKNRSVSDETLSQKNILVLLQKASCTLRFWENSIWRDEFLRFVKVQLSGDPDHHGHMALGIVAYLNGDDVGAGTHFTRSIEGDSPFTETGATSFLSTVATTSKSESFLRCNGITFDGAELQESAVVTCADEVYFKRYAVPYLKSLRETGSKCLVHFHIAGNKIRLKEFVASVSEFGPVSFSYETPPHKSPAYYASMRFLKAPYFVEKVARFILLTDIDVAFRSDPEALIANCIETDSDIMFRVYDTIRIVNQASKLRRPIYRYPRTYPWAHVNAACLCLTNTPMGKYAAKEIARDMADHLTTVLVSGKRAWWVDQNSLLFTYRSLLSNSEIKIGNIENFGVPFGSFDYSEVQVVGGKSPSLTPKQGRRSLPRAGRQSLWKRMSKIVGGIGGFSYLRR